MVSLMLVAENERELQILKMAFEQRGLSVLISKAQYQNYVKTLQYLPDIILIEIPTVHLQHLHFAELIKNHKKTRRTPILGYGNKLQVVEKNGVTKVGITYYFERPLKFTQLIKVIETLLKQFNKNLESKPVAQDKEKDVELLLTTTTPPLKKIEIITSYVSSLLAFPFTVTKVLSLAESEKSAASDLAKVIEADPVLSTQILRLSNSVLFASLNRRISSIQDAIVRIGLRETKRLVMSMSVMQLFDPKNKNLGFDRMGFWCHSLGTGIIAERLARRMGNINSDEVFLAGLLHDFGIIILDEFFPTIFAKILEETANTGGLFIEREKSLLGITHNDVLIELFVKWKIPDLVREGISHQYDAESFKDNPDTPEKRTAIILATSNILAKTIVMGKECDQYITPIPQEFLALAKIPTGFTTAFIDDVDHEMKVYKEFFKLDIASASAENDGLTLSDKTKIGFINLSTDTFTPPLLYFKKEGYSVTSISEKEDMAKYDSAFDIILAWTGPSVLPDQIQKISHLVKFSEIPPAPESPITFAPVLAIIPPQTAAIAKDPSLKNVSFCYNSFDLRQLDRYATDMLLGQPVALQENTPNSTMIAPIVLSHSEPEPQKPATESPKEPQPQNKATPPPKEKGSAA